MLRSLAFTCLLEWPEFASLEVVPRPLGTLIVTDFVGKVEAAQAKGDTRSVYALYLEYRRDITANETADPGVLTRYAETLLAQKEREGE